MIKVSVLYPQKAGAKFDMDYYCDSHMPLVQSKLKPALKGIAVDKGLAGGAPGAPPSYVAMCHLWFESAAAFERVRPAAAASVRHPELHGHRADRADQRSQRST